MNDAQLEQAWALYREMRPQSFLQRGWFDDELWKRCVLLAQKIISCEFGR